MLSPTLPVGTELKDYRITDLLGQDAVGTLYRAEHIILGQTVILREFVPAHCAVLASDSYLFTALPGMESAVQTAYEEFLGALRVWGNLHHPALHGVLTAFSGPTGTVYAVLPYAESTPLLRGRSVEEKLRPILKQALDALGYLYSRNLCPVDFTPDCVAVAGKQLQLSLFGVLRHLDQPCSPGGTPGYAALEQLQGKQSGMSACIYALGAVFYHAVCGEPPLEAPKRLGKQDRYQPLVGRNELQGRFCDDFLRTIDKALNLWPEDRWSDFANWAAALEARAESERSAALISGGSGLRLGGGSLNTGGSGVKLGENPGSRMSMAGSACCESGRTGSMSIYELSDSPDVRRRAKARLRSLDIPEEDYVPIAFRAIREKEARMVKIMLNAGVDANAVDGAGCPLLCRAAGVGSVEIVRALLDAGADVNCRCRDGQTPLLEAAGNNCVRVAALLLERGADVNLADESRLTALKTTAFTNCAPMIRVLIPYEPNPWIVGEEAWVPSEQTEDPECQRLLRDYEDLYESKYGITPEMIEAFRYSLDGKVDREMYDAVYEQDARALRLAAATGADVNKKDKNGNTALHLAASAGKPKYVQTLIDLGADPCLKNTEGKLPVEVAKDDAILAILQDAMNDIA